MPGVHDPIKVGEAVFSIDKGCTYCGNQNGPFTDADRELPGFGRLYLCASCVRLHARALGFVEGDEHTSLLNAAQRELEMQKQLEKVTRERNNARERLTSERKVTGDQAERLEWCAERIKQLELLIRSAAEANLSVISVETVGEA